MRGWNPLRQSDYGPLWEHVRLEHLAVHYPKFPPHYWRHGGHKLDFVLVRSRDPVDAIECKWDSVEFDASNLRVFRSACRTATTTSSALSRRRPSGSVTAAWMSRSVRRRKWWSEDSNFSISHPEGIQRRGRSSRSCRKQSGSSQALSHDSSDRPDKIDRIAKNLLT